MGRPMGCHDMLPDHWKTCSSHAELSISWKHNLLRKVSARVGASLDTLVVEPQVELRSDVPEPRFLVLSPEASVRQCRQEIS